MNFKDRGVTVGDLLIAIILILITFFIINKFKGNEDQQQLNKLPFFEEIIKIT